MTLSGPGNRDVALGKMGNSVRYCRGQRGNAMPYKGDEKGQMIGGTEGNMLGH